LAGGQIKELIYRHCSEILTGSQANGNGRRFNLSLANYKHVGNLEHLRIANLCLHPFLLIEQFDSETQRLGMRLDSLAELDLIISDRDKSHLNWC
jgi:hypothetical protein